jgi:hypothetical protein
MAEAVEVDKTTRRERGAKPKSAPALLLFLALVTFHSTLLFGQRFSHVQGAMVQVTRAWTSGPFTLTLASNPAQGDLVVAAFASLGCTNGGPSPVTIKDANGASYAVISIPATLSGIRVRALIIKELFIIKTAEFERENLCASDLLAGEKGNHCRGTLEEFLRPGLSRTGNSRDEVAFAPPLVDPLALWALAGQKERFDEFSFAANRHSRETSEPFAVGDFWFGVEPPGKHPRPRSRNLALLDAVKQVTEEGGREMVTPNSRHGTAPQGQTELSASSAAQELTGRKKAFWVSS